MTGNGHASHSWKEKRQHRKKRDDSRIIAGRQQSVSFRKPFFFGHSVSVDLFAALAVFSARRAFRRIRHTARTAGVLLFRAFRGSKKKVHSMTYEKCKSRTIWMIVACAALLLFGTMAADRAYGAVSYVDPVLDVYYDDTLVRQFTMEELNAIASAEGDKTYTYSRFNTNSTPTADRISAKGPTIEGIVNEALNDPTDPQNAQLPADLDAVGSDQTIELKASSRSANAYSAVFTKTQLFETRYYYPNWEQEKDRTGHAAMQASYEGREEVPPIISTEETDGGNNPGRSLYGQLVPNEQNAPDCVQGMLRINSLANPGRITISSRTAQKWNPVQTTDAGTGGDVLTGTEISFDRSANTFNSKGGSRFWIYYTLDGTDPTLGSEEYNYNNYSYGEDGECINRPKVTGTGDLVIKARVIGNGKPDSDVTTFRFRGVKDLIDVDIYGTSASKIYSGVEQSAQGFTFTTVPEGAASVTAKDLSRVRASGKDAGTYSMSLRADQFEITPADPDCGIGNVTLHNGRLVIQPAKLVITTNSAKKLFDGRALTAAGSIQGLVNGETVAFAAAGKQTAPGSSRNTYSLLWNRTAKKTNYTISSTRLGTLTVTAPSVAAPKLKKLTAKKRTITVNWAKVSGASGYEIYRSTKKTGSYRMVKKISKGSTVSWKNKGLKKGKKYYYKVRAYRTIAGKNFYSGFSPIKYKKIK